MCEMELILILMDDLVCLVYPICAPSSLYAFVCCVTVRNFFMVFAPPCNNSKYSRCKANCTYFTSDFYEKTRRDMGIFNIINRWKIKPLLKEFLANIL